MKGIIMKLITLIGVSTRGEVCTDLRNNRLLWVFCSQRCKNVEYVFCIYRPLLLHSYAKSPDKRHLSKRKLKSLN